MSYNPNIHHRKSIRLKGYDYSQAGLYFITICVQNRQCLFGDVVNEKMILNDAGKMVENEWLKLHERFTNTELHEFVVMPNHFHGIIEIVGVTLVVGPETRYNQNEIEKNGDETIEENQQLGKPQAFNQLGQPQGFGQLGQPQAFDQLGQPQGIAPTSQTKKQKTVGDMVGAFQSIATVEYIRGVKNLGWKSFNGKLWQRNYWEHIIRDEKSYHRIAEYINNNPKNWKKDKLQ